MVIITVTLKKIKIRQPNYSVSQNVLGLLHRITGEMSYKFFDTVFGNLQLSNKESQILHSFACGQNNNILATIFLTLRICAHLFIRVACAQRIIFEVTFPRMSYFIAIVV